MDKLLDGVICGFTSNDFMDDRKLSGEFLLGYHCQRRFLNPPKADSSADDKQTTSD
jgi:CRISPR-associated protein Csd1